MKMRPHPVARTAVTDVGSFTWLRTVAYTAARHTASFFKRTDGRLTEPPSFSAACSLCSRSVAPLIAFLPFYGLITPTRRTVPSSPPPSLHARSFSGPISLSVRNLTHLVLPFEGSLKSTTAWSSSVFVPPILKVVISPFPLFRRTKGPWIGFQQSAKRKRNAVESDLSEGVGGGEAE